MFCAVLDDVVALVNRYVVNESDRVRLVSALLELDNRQRLFMVKVFVDEHGQFREKDNDKQ